MKQLSRIILAAALVITGAIGTTAANAQDPGLTLHVAVDGDDAAAGTSDDPLATLSGARDAIRALGDHPAGGVTVLVHEGVYQLSETVAFGAADSGTAQSPITYRAADGADVRITGGPTLDGSLATPVTDADVRARLTESSRDRVVQLDLTDVGDLGEYRDYGYARGTNPSPAELFIDDLPLTVASWPVDIPIGAIHDPGSNPSLGERDNRGATFELDTERLDRWSEADQMYVAGFLWHGWAHDAIRVAEIDATERMVTLAAASQYSVRNGQSWSTVRVSNLLEEIDQPGEYVIDHTTQTAYLYPRGELTGAKVQVSLLDTPMLSVIEASHLEFRGLTFENSRGLGIYVEGGEQVTIAGNTFHNLGEVAVSVGQGFPSPAYLGDPTPRQPASNVVGALQGRLAAHNAWNRNGGVDHQIVGNDVRNTGAGGILVGSGDRKTLSPAGIRIANNDVRRFNRWLTTQAPGIWVNGAGMLVEHNLVGDAPQRAMFVNGNLHTIRKNEIYGAVQDADDVGAIGMYRDPSEFGNVFEHNFIHDNAVDGGHGTHGAQGIFLDDGTSGQIVRGNVFVRAGSNYAVKLHGGRHNVIENNIFVDTPTAVGLATWSDQRWQEQLNSPLYQQRLLDEVDIRDEPYASTYPTLATYLDADGQATSQPPDSNLIADNVVVGDGRLASNTTATFGDNFVTVEDPGFADPDALDYSLDPDSPVYDELPGFEPIPFGEIGLYLDDYRTSTDPDLGSFELIAPAHGTQNVNPLDPPTLHWQESRNADGYRVQVAEGSDFANPVVDVYTREPELQLSGELTYGTVYSWRVRAESQSLSRPGTRWHEGGNRAFRTREVSAEPSRPDVTVDASAPGVAVLSWDSVDHATEYAVLRAEALAGGVPGAYREIHRGTAQSLTNGAGVASFSDDAAPQVVDLRYAVVATNTLGESDPSDPVSIEADLLEAFADDFTDGRGAHWREPDGYDPGHWRVVGADEDDARLRLLAAGIRGREHAVVVDPPDAETFVVSAEVRLTNGDRGFGGLIAASESGEYRLSYAGAEVRLEHSGGESVTAPAEIDDAATFALAVTEDAIHGLVDGVATLTLPVSSPPDVTAVGLAGGNVVADFSNVRIHIPRWGVLPEGWQLSTYGQHPTLVAHDDGTWTIRAVGEDVWGEHDELGFVYQPVTRPDGGRVEISARVESLEEIATPPMAGIMIREEDTAVAANVFSRTVAAGSNQTTIRHLPAYSTTHTSVPGLGQPIELRLVWEGVTITSYYRLDSADDWIEHTVNEIHLDDEVLIGLGVSARDRDTYTEAVISDVEVIVVP
jgi:hypothetical protein